MSMPPALTAQSGLHALAHAVRPPPPQPPPSFARRMHRLPAHAVAPPGASSWPPSAALLCPRTRGALRLPSLFRSRTPRAARLPARAIRAHSMRGVCRRGRRCMLQPPPLQPAPLGYTHARTRTRTRAFTASHPALQLERDRLIPPHSAGAH